ncbi:hypothetical protein FKM82_009239 [Ascaphus truei]
MYIWIAADRPSLITYHFTSLNCLISCALIFHPLKPSLNQELRHCAQVSHFPCIYLHSFGVLHTHIPKYMPCQVQLRYLLFFCYDYLFFMSAQFDLFVVILCDHFF